MEPVTATIVAAAITATATAGAAATSAGVSQQESGFIAGATIVNNSSLDFEISYFNEIRGSWGKAPSRQLLGTQTVLNNILDAHPVDPEQPESAIEKYVKEKIVSDSFSQTSLYYSGINHGIGFQGCLKLENEENNLIIILYIGRPRNLAFRAAVWIGNSSSSQLESYGNNAAKWEEWMNDVRNDDSATNPTFSLGSTRITEYRSFKVKYTSAERVEFEIKDNWEVDFLAPFNKKDIYYGNQVSIRSYHRRYLQANNTGKLFANSSDVGNNEKFTIINADNPSNIANKIQYGDRVALLSTFDKYMVAESNGSANIDRTALHLWETWTILNPDNLNDRGDISPDKKVAFKSAHQRYLVAESNGDVNANRTQIGNWEKWNIMSL